jgi:hypothetical protein
MQNEEVFRVLTCQPLVGEIPFSVSFVAFCVLPLSELQRLKTRRIETIQHRRSQRSQSYFVKHDAGLRTSILRVLCALLCIRYFGMLIRKVGPCSILLKMKTLLIWRKK